MERIPPLRNSKKQTQPSMRKLQRLVTPAVEPLNRFIRLNR